MRLLLSFFLLFSALYGLPFTEIRYSDAFNKSVTLQGNITFGDERVSIAYKENNESLFYDDGDLTIYENGKEHPLDAMQEERMAAFFDILLLLHSNNQRLLEENFDIKHTKAYDILLPKGDMQEYIKKIEIARVKGELSFVKLFLKNSDTITIKIENETED
jgi:hypothetical protein